jgi:hypothetical protein
MEGISSPGSGEKLSGYPRRSQADARFHNMNNLTALQACVSAPMTRYRAPQYRAQLTFRYDGMVESGARTDCLTARRKPRNTGNLPDRAILPAEIVEDLQADRDQFAQIAADLAKGPSVGIGSAGTSETVATKTSA